MDLLDSTLFKTHCNKFVSVKLSKELSLLLLYI